MLSVGAKGVISVVANIVPREIAELVASYEKGNISQAQNLHYKLFPLMKALFIETNPIPIKTAMALKGMILNELRLPMCEMEEANLNKLKKHYLTSD